MQAILKLSALPTLFRRVCLSMGPALRGAVPVRRRAEAACDDWRTDSDAGEGPFRVTDRRLRWSRVRHFMDAGTALRHAGATGGVVWERYVGPTGAVNWWSLTEEECEARVDAGWPVEGACEPAGAGVRRESRAAAV